MKLNWNHIQNFHYHSTSLPTTGCSCSFLVHFCTSGATSFTSDLILSNVMLLENDYYYLRPRCCCVLTVWMLKPWEGLWANMDPADQAKRGVTGSNVPLLLWHLTLAAPPPPPPQALIDFSNKLASAPTNHRTVTGVHCGQNRHLLTVSNNVFVQLHVC